MSIFDFERQDPMEEKQMIATYLQMLNSSLIRKVEILEELLELTEEQNLAFTNENSTFEVIEQCVEKKEPLIRQINEMDNGFDSVYSKIKDAVYKNKELYRSELQQLQESIVKVTELSVKIQTLEQNNKLKFEVFSNNKRQEIKQFKVSNKTVSTYYKNMTGKPQGESYFYDKKK